MEKYFDTVLGSNGAIIKGGSVSIFPYGSTTIAPLFANAAGTVPKANPLTTDALGYFEFYAANGRYSMLIAADGFISKNVADVQQEDPNDFSALVVSATADLAAYVVTATTQASSAASAAAASAVIAEGNVLLVAGAADSADSASTSAASASGSASVAINSANTATDQAAQASASAAEALVSQQAAATSAANSATAATTQASASLASSALSEKWATQLVEPVSGGEYSAKYWALQTAASVTGQLVYRGGWAASTAAYPGSPSLGDYYKVTADGTTGGVIYNTNDSIIYNGSGWDKIDSTDQVTSVAGKVGAVVLNSSDVGLGSVNNTSDANKPISSLTATALAGKQASGSYQPAGSYPTGSGTSSGTNTGDQTASSLGLGNVTNTSDANKPVSTAQQTALNLKVSQTSSTGSAQLPTGTQAQRDASPVAGSLRFNSSIGKPEVFNGSTWGSVGDGASGGGASALTISDKTAAYTVVAGDLGAVINCTSGTFTVSLTAAATLGSGFNVTIWNTGTGTVTVDPSASEQIGSSPGNGNTTYRLRFGAGVKLVCDGTFWHIEIAKPYGNYVSTICLGDNAFTNNNYSLAIGANTSAGGVSSTAFGASNSLTIFASGNYSFAAGLNSAQQGSQAIGAGAMALGGSYASGTDSFAVAIGSNSAAYGAQGANSVAIGAGLARASAARALALMNNAIASGTDSIAMGIGTTASSPNSVAIGNGAVAAQSGKIAITGSNIAGSGQSQMGIIVLLGATTDATPRILNSTNNATSNTTNQLVLANSQAMTFTGTIVARQQAAGGTASAAWKVEGLIRREANAASTTLVASTVTDISNVPAWVIALTADTTNGALAVTATGAAATNIRWVATLQTSEVIYA